MKRRIIISSALLVLILINFIPINRSITFTIDASYYNVYRYLAEPENWFKWQPGLRVDIHNNKYKTDSSNSAFTITAQQIAFHVRRIGLGNFAISMTQNGRIYQYKYMLLPENEKNKTIITENRKTTLFGYLLSLIKGDKLNGSPIKDLKDYMENPEMYYGFRIYKQQTPEKFLIVKETVNPNRLKYLQIAPMLDELNAFVSENQLKVIYPVQFQSISSNSDSTHIMIGLPVNKKVVVKNKFQLMDMPRGNILIGIFNGRYQDKKKIYDAMQLYIDDNYIHPLIRPYETFLNNKLPGADTTTVNMKVVIPFM